MTKTIYRCVTSKRRTSRPKAKSKAATAPFVGMMARLDRASALLSAARRGR